MMGKNAQINFRLLCNQKKNKVVFLQNKFRPLKSFNFDSWRS